jgi:hypothetical protein
LAVGSERAAQAGPFLPIEAKPAEVLDQGGQKVGSAPGAVKIFVAQDENAAVFSASFLGDPKGARVSKVQQARG